MEARSLVAAIDQGTTSSRCILFDRSGAIRSTHQLEHAQITPRPGWVEHDADEILERVRTCVRVALRDSSGCVVLEAMAHGLPIVLLNHQGVACYVPDDAGLKVAVTNPKQVIDDLAKAITTLANSSAEQRDTMSRAALNAARRETWDQRAKVIAGWYQEIVAHSD